jgi:hypothetical protein
MNFPPTASSFSALAALPAIARLAVVHGTIFAGLFAIRFIRCKGDRAHGRDQNRKQDFRVILHGTSLCAMSPGASEKIRFFVRLRPTNCISLSVDQLKTIVATCLLALWMPATSLCLIENAGWLKKSDGCCDTQSSETLPCCALASATYKMDESRSAKAPVVQLFVAPIDLANLNSMPQQFASVAECGVSPPELSASWQFSFRAALMPRAPSAS